MSAQSQARAGESGCGAASPYVFSATGEGRTGSRVAVARTADDRRRCWRILRGTGLAGLAGIHPQAGTVFRPLLGIRRRWAYLREKRQTWREDATNQDETRTRARIRASYAFWRRNSRIQLWSICANWPNWLARYAREFECELRLSAVAKARTEAQLSGSVSWRWRKRPKES
jgi:tRNA(Ile)-lysidine synthase TilS/MesJ